MNRRGFFGLLGGAVAGIALEQAIPFGRVWSFPSEIVIQPDLFMPMDEFERRYITPAVQAFLQRGDVFTMKTCAESYHRKRQFIATESVSLDRQGDGHMVVVPLIFP